MLLCKVHNIITGGRYEFQAANQAEIDAKIVSKAAVYGRTAWTETIPAWTDATTVPPVEHPAQVIDHPAEHVLEITNIDAEIAAAEAERTARQEARAYFRGLDWSKIPDLETRRGIRHIWRLLRRIDSDGA